ncbi:hypothetical protein A1359_12330 [Methylomonas lenta]|uniref:Uncharacterized protein n=2 Tax=Methylomonas lenta TaxID=980561 RepID=A0A177N6J0_9GAMM|nr:hypothetical protein A1359_12330 [Methylomonas lenta]
MENFAGALNGRLWPVGATGGFRLEFLAGLTSESVADFIGIRISVDYTILLAEREGLRNTLSIEVQSAQ